jgi:flagellar FliJ protein
MKRFRFPLRPIAVIRAHRELRAKEAFAAAVHAYVSAEEALAQTRARVSRLAQALSEHRGGVFSPVEAAETFRAYRAECEEVMRAERRMIEARDAMQRRRADYFDAHRELKVVQRLEEKARANHRLESSRAEQAEIDEFAGLRHGRRPVLT